MDDLIRTINQDNVLLKKFDETSFLDNEPVQEAVIRNFEIIGEVSRSTSGYNNQLFYYF